MKRLPRPTYANVAATLALILAMAGGAYALTLPRNSVKSRHIAPKAVKTGDLANNAVTARKVRANAISGAKVAGASLQASDLAAGQIAAAVTGGGAAPAAVPLAPATSTNITISRPGRLLVFGWIDASLDCGAVDPCSDTWGLYVDSTPVPGSGSTLNDVSDDSVPVRRSLFLAGTTAQLAAGTYTLDLSFAPSDGGNETSNANDARVGALLLGP
jgi:hypothetical protein